jgi:hypothetical protein
LRVAVPDPARPALTIQVGPPDFLVSGPLYDAFFHALNVPGAVADLARALGVARGFIPPFLREAQENGAVIFRAQRVFDEDANVLLLRGRLAGQELTIVIETLFRVQAHRNPPVVEHVPGFIDVILGRGEDAATKRVDASSVEGILAFLGNLHVWTKVAG